MNRRPERSLGDRLLGCVPLAFAAVVWLPGLAGGSIVNGDDAFYASVIRNLAENRVDLLTALGWRMPLFYLLGWLSVAVLGLSELALRLPSVVSGLACVWLTYELGRALWPERRWLAFWAAMMLASFGQMFIFARRVRGLDLLLTALALAGLALAVNAGDRLWRWASVGVFIGLGFLTKSVVILVFGPAFAVLWLLSRARPAAVGAAPTSSASADQTVSDRGGTRSSARSDGSADATPVGPSGWRGRLRAALAVAAGAVVPVGIWLAWAVSSRKTAGLEEHFATHVVARGVGGSLVGEAGGLDFYLRALFDYEGWVGLAALVAALGLLILGLRGRRAGLTVGVWVISVVVAFSLATTKLPHYLLPAYPALALALMAAIEAMGGALQRIGRRPRDPRDARPSSTREVEPRTHWLVHWVAGGAVVVALMASPIRILQSWGQADWSPHLKQGAQAARDWLGESGQLFVFNEYHAAASFYFEGPTRLLTTDPGFAREYARVAGFVESDVFEWVAPEAVGHTVLEARPACLLVREDRAPPEFEAMLGPQFSAIPVSGAVVYCTPRSE